MSVQNQMYLLMSAIQKAIRKGLINDSRSFAHQLMAIEQTKCTFWPIEDYCSRRYRISRSEHC